MLPVLVRECPRQVKIHRWIFQENLTTSPSKLGRTPPYTPLGMVWDYINNPEVLAVPLLGAAKSGPVLARIRPGLSPMTDLLVALLSQQGAQKSTLCWGIQSVWCGYSLSCPSQLLFILLLCSGLCQHVKPSHLLDEQKCLVLLAMFSPELFNIFVLMLWYSLQSSYFQHS